MKRKPQAEIVRLKKNHFFLSNEEQDEVKKIEWKALETKIKK